jgi:Sulfatase
MNDDRDAPTSPARSSVPRPGHFADDRADSRAGARPVTGHGDAPAPPSPSPSLSPSGTTSPAEVAPSKIAPSETGPSESDPSEPGSGQPDMREIVGSHDILMITLDTLRYDVAAELAAAGRIPNLAAHLPNGSWERRHSPGSFTYAAHQAIFAGFLPTPADSRGPHPRLFAARFAGSESTATTSFVYDTPDLVSGLATEGYRTVCVGGVGFFNKHSPMGSVLPALFQESHWAKETGVTSPTSFESQVAVVERVTDRRPQDDGRPLFLFVNVSALHQPNWYHLPGATRESGDTLASHAAALEYVDRHIPRLFAAMSRRRPCFTIVCSDHGTAYGEDGFSGHRIGHEVVWTVPYADFTLPIGSHSTDENVDEGAFA